MKFVVGPSWLRVAVTFDDDAFARSLTPLFEKIGANGEDGDAGPGLRVKSLSDEPAAGEVEASFRLEDEVLRGVGAYGRGYYDLGEKSGEISVTPYGATFFETFLRQLFLWETHRQGAVALHGVALGHGDDAVLSCGPSGSGKSTLAKMLGKRYTVYSDEANVVDAAGRVWALPIHGSAAATVNAGGGRLRAITIHRPGKEFSANRLDAAAAARALWQNVFVPAAAPGAVRARTFERLADAAANVAVFAVAVPLDERASAAGFAKLFEENGTDNRSVALWRKDTLSPQLTARRSSR